jgi:hypothetical protein
MVLDHQGCAKVLPKLSRPSKQLKHFCEIYVNVYINVVWEIVIMTTL